MDREAWRAVVHGVAKSRTWLSELNWTEPRQHIKKQRRYFVNKGPSSQGYGFSSSHVWMWDLDHKKSWALKNWTVVLEKTVESPLDCKKMKPVNLKGNQSWIFIGRTDVKAETPILLPHYAKIWVVWKYPDAGKDWRWEEKGGWQRMSWLDDITDSWMWVWVNSGSWWWTGRLGVLHPMGSQSQTQWSDWNELNWNE